MIDQLKRGGCRWRKDGVPTGGRVGIRRTSRKGEDSHQGLSGMGCGLVTTDPYKALKGM